MTVYCIAQAKNINPDALEEYRAHAKDALSKYDGALVTSSANIIQVEGEPTGYESIALVTFPDAQSALNWRQDAELAPVHAMRARSGTWSIQMLG